MERDQEYFEKTKRNHTWIGGKEGQNTIKNLTIGVAGLGGMGSHIAELLVRAGVRKLKIADFDTVDTSNINRQIIANENTVGQKKINATTDRLKSLSSNIELYPFPEGLTSKNAKDFVSNCDCIVDEIDVYPLMSHIYLHREANKLNIPLYSSYVVGTGTRFYKFQGTDYTLEDFLGPNQSLWEKPTASYLLDLYLPPCPNYIQDSTLDRYTNEIAQGSAPIFGPATLLGQSLLVTRILFDTIKSQRKNTFDYQMTPIMPNFLSIDPLDFSFEVCRVKSY